MNHINQLSVGDELKPWLRSPENRILIYCSRISIDKEIENKLKILVVSGIDWQRLILRATKQGVAQFLYLHLSKIEEIWSNMPQEKDILKQFYYKILARNWFIQRELKKILSFLNEVSSRIIVLKGAGLLETIYKNIALRPMVDVDLLVESKDLSRIRSILEERGYQKPDFLDQDSLEKFGGEIHLYKPAGVFLDIHTSFTQYERFNKIFRIDLDEEIWTKSRTYKTREGQIRVLNPTHLVMHLCMHQAIAHAFTGLFRFCDLHEAILAYRYQIDWQDLVAKAKRYKIRKIIYYSLLFTQELFGQIIFDEVLDNLRQNKKQLFLTDIFVSKKKILSLPDIEPTFKKCISQLFLMDNFLDIPKIIIRGLFPSNEWLRYRYRINKRIKLIFYRLFHPLITVFNILF